MRSEENPLDLNNLPEDYSKDGKQVIEDSSSYAAAGYRRKKSGAKDGKDDSGKVYECRFCSLKFCKSQALGGHMNRHRQERETETLNRARQLVFNNDPLLGQGPHHHHHHHLGQPMQQGGFHQTANLSDPTMPFRSVYPTRLFSGSTPTLLPQGQPSPQSPYMYSSPSRLVPFPSQFPAVNDYFVGHVVPGGNAAYSSCSPNQAEITGNNYTCIGAPVIGHAFNGSITRGSSTTDHHASGGGGVGADDVGGGGSREMTLYNNHDEGLNWGRSGSCTGGAGGTTQKRLDPSSINRFQDGF
nr:zinc finger protein JAGGED-like [Coffea arabica]